LKESLGIFSSDVGIFYSLLVICITFSLLPNEIEKGKMILAVCAGYSKNAFFLSKQITYVFFCAIPVMPIYIIYFIIGSTFLENNIDINHVIINAIVALIIELLISSRTIALSVIYRHKYAALISMASTIVILPDFISLFSFGKYFPTYLLSYIYSSSSEIETLIIPLM